MILGEIKKHTTFPLTDCEASGDDKLMIVRKFSKDKGRDGNKVANSSEPLFSMVCVTLIGGLTKVSK